MLKPATPFGKWTKEEDTILRDGLASDASGEAVMALLPGRSASGARKRAMQKGWPGHQKLRRLDRLSASPEAALRRAQRDLEYQREHFSQPIQYKPRTCLKCRKTFMSWGPGNRLCVDHRQADSYEMI